MPQVRGRRKKVHIQDYGWHLALKPKETRERGLFWCPSETQATNWRTGEDMSCWLCPIQLFYFRSKGSSSQEIEFRAMARNVMPQC